MTTIEGSNSLFKPKAVRPSISFHASKSMELMGNGKFASSPNNKARTPVPPHTKSIESTIVSKPSLKGLMCHPLHGGSSLTLGELAKIENEVKCRASLASKQSSSDTSRSGFPKTSIAIVRQLSPCKKSSFAPPSRPSNPLVKDKLWTNCECDNTSTDNDSDHETKK